MCLTVLTVLDADVFSFSQRAVTWPPTSRAGSSKPRRKLESMLTRPSTTWSVRSVGTTKTRPEVRPRRVEVPVPKAVATVEPAVAQDTTRNKTTTQAAAAVASSCKVVAATTMRRVEKELSINDTTRHVPGRHHQSVVPLAQKTPFLFSFPYYSHLHFLSSIRVSSCSVSFFFAPVTDRRIGWLIWG